MKIIELSPVAGLIMPLLVAVVMIITRYNQRFGDLLARTAVIDAASLPVGGLPPGQTDQADNQPANPESPPPLPPGPAKPDKDDQSGQGE